MSQKSQEPGNPEPQGPVPPYEGRKQGADPDAVPPEETGDVNVKGAAMRGVTRSTDEADPGPSSVDEIGTSDPAATAPGVRSGTADDEELRRSGEERGRAEGATGEGVDGRSAEDRRADRENVGLAQTGPTDDGATDLQAGDQGG